VMQSRSHRSIVPFDRSVAQLRHHLDQLQAQAVQSQAAKKLRSK
jgi:hypothetical protein